MPSQNGKPCKLPTAYELAEMVRDGWTHTAIGNVYGASARSVASLLTDAGFTSGGQVRTAKPQAPKLPDAGDRRMLPADSEALCTDPAYRVEFEAVLDAQFATRVNKDRLSIAQRRAKAVCGMCPVRATCLRVLGSDPQTYGVVGGLTDRERKPLMVKASA